MLHSSSKRIASFFVANNIIKEEDAPVYAYGMELILATVLNGLVVFVMGILLGRLVETVFFLASFAVLRSYAGGYHASTHFKCLMVLVGAYAVNMAILWAMPAQWMLAASAALECIAVALVFLLAPVESENKPLDDDEKREYKTKSRVWCLAFAVAAIAGQALFPQVREWFFGMTLGIVTAAVSTATAFQKYKSAKEGSQ